MRPDGNDDARDGESEEAWDGDWYDEEHAEWMDKWAPKCPIGNPQRVGDLLGYREREPGRLQLRVAVAPATDGVCDVIVRETDDAVQVRVLLCFEDCDESWDSRASMDCPVHVYLDEPLGNRTVIDVDSHRPLPLYAPQWEIEHNRRVQEELDAARRRESSEAGSDPPASMD
jgi:hypothetical protein